MSFSSDVKNEIAVNFSPARHCNIAEIAAIINMCGHIIIYCGVVNIKVQTENIVTAQKYFTLIKNTFNICADVSVRKNHLNSNNICTVIIRKKAEAVLISTGIFTNRSGRNYISSSINPLIVKNVCCKRAYIKGAFLSGGSLSNPEKTYHLEFVNNSYQHSIDLKNIIKYFDIDVKIIERKGHFIVYLKDGEKIVDLLNIIGAHMSLMNLENVRILKDMRNNVNRIVNCETANLSKTVYASIKQLEDIRYIQNTVGLDNLPKLLKDVADKRLMFPEASLKELGQMLSPTIGKSGVNHRLKKISSIAERIRENREDHYV